MFAAVAPTSMTHCSTTPLCKLLTNCVPLSSPKLAAQSRMPAFFIAIVRDPVTRSSLASHAAAGFGEMVKAVVDVDRGVSDPAIQTAIRGIVSALVTIP